MKEKKEKNEFEAKLPIVFLIIVLIVIGIFVGKKFISNKGNETQNQTEKDNSSLISGDEQYAGQFDANNMENAKIVEGSKVNTSSNLLKEREVSGLKLTDIDLKAQDGISNFTATVTNDKDTDFEGGVGTITFVDKNGSRIEELQVNIPRIKAGNKSNINTGTTSDITNSYDFKIDLSE